MTDMNLGMSTHVTPLHTKVARMVRDDIASRTRNTWPRSTSVTVGNSRRAKPKSWRG